MNGESDTEDRERLKEAVQASHAAAKALIKDAAALSRQSALLKTKATETRAESQKTRTQSSPADPSPHLLTIPEAARILHIPERTLRQVLAEPDLQARLIERTRKIGIYYKFISLLPPDLMADLPARFADKELPE